MTREGVKQPLHFCSVDISAHLKCMANPSPSLQGDVIEKGVGIYSITHTPQVRGRHDLIVKVKDKEIDGSPFRVVVKIPPTQLGQPVHQIEGLKCPWGIAINNKQQLVVAENEVFGGGGKITIMERDGNKLHTEWKKVQTVHCSKFKYPHGVAAGSDRALYVTDIGAKCLFKFNKKGKLLTTVRNELHEPHFVKIIQNQLYVADRASSQVKIFDMDCNIIGTIQTKECPNPSDIAEGPDGLYVAGEKKISVYRCAPNGNFVRHLNIQPSSLNLSAFWGICVDSSGHIIASDHNNGVYVFKPSGECVGHVSSDVFDGPSGVTVDEDGFVYVCENWSTNIVVL